MKAAVVARETGREQERKVLTVVDLPAPAAPGADEVQIAVGHVGICGSDLHGFLDAGSTARADGLIMGHEISGRVVAIGYGVVSVAVGDCVTIDPQVHCRACPACRAGLISICVHKRVLGSSLRGFEQGGLQQLLTVPAHLAQAVPDSVSEWEAALVEPLANAWHVIERAEPVPSDTVLILGAGPLGLAMTAILRRHGVSQVIVTDVSEHRRQTAVDLGADLVLDPLQVDVEAQVRAHTSGAGADVVVESVGLSATYQQALECARLRGRVMFFGAVQPTVELPLMRILHLELTLIGCTGANAVDTEAVIEALADKSLDITALTRRSVPLEDAEEAIRSLTDPDNVTVKLFVEPNAGRGEDYGSQDPHPG